MYCAKHTRLFRDLSDNPDMPSQLTEMLCNDDGNDEINDEDPEDVAMIQKAMMNNPEDDTFAQFNEDDDVLGNPIEDINNEMNSFFPEN